MVYVHEFHQAYVILIAFRGTNLMWTTFSESKVLYPTILEYWPALLHGVNLYTCLKLHHTCNDKFRKVFNSAFNGSQQDDDVWLLSCLTYLRYKIVEQDRRRL